MNYEDMTNEQLAILIKSGGKSELKLLLWERVRVLLHMKAERLYHTNSERCKRCGVDKSDLRQSCYLVFLQALDGYDSSKGYKFTAFLSYPFKTMAAEMLGYRTSKTDTLDICESFDKPIGGEDEDLTLLDMLKDENAVDVLELLDKQADGETVRQEVAKLMPKQREIIEKHYFENVPFKDIAEKFGLSCSRILQIRNNGFRQLRASKNMQKLHYESIYEIHYSGFLQPEEYYLKHRLHRKI